MYFAIVGTMVMEAIVKAQADRITQNRRNMKVSELTGGALDYWVAKALGRDVELSWAWKVPACSEDWLKGGPIIERERISVTFPEVDPAPGFEWHANIAQPDESFNQYGPTPLIAAMRAYVASKYGDEVPGN